MQNFQNVDSNTFKFNGIKYVKNFLVIKQGITNISLVNAYDTSFQLMGSTHFSQVSVDGLTYSSQSALMNVLAPMLFAKQIVDVNGVLSSYTGFTDTYSTGGTYSDGTATITNNQGASFSISGFTKPQNLQDVTDIDNESTNSLRVIDSTDSNFFGELKKNQILLHTSTGGGVGFNADNSTEYYRLQAPNKIGGIDRTIATIDDLTGVTGTYTTGGTYSAGTAVFTNNVGGTFSVSGFSTGSTIPTLQEVTQAGYSTTIGIVVKNDLDGNSTVNLFNDEENVGIVSIVNPSDFTSIQVLSDRINFGKNIDYSYWFRPNTTKPSGDYVLATTDDLTGFTNNVPYTGGTKNVDLNGFGITSNSFITPITTTGYFNVVKGGIGGYDSFNYQSISDSTGDNFGSVSLNINPEEGITLSKNSTDYSASFGIGDGYMAFYTTNDSNTNSMYLYPDRLSISQGLETYYLSLYDTANSVFGGNISYTDGLFSFKDANGNNLYDMYAGFFGFTNENNISSYLCNTSVTNNNIVLNIPNKASGQYTIATTADLKDTVVTGGTYSAGTTTFRNNTGGTFSVSGYSTGYTLSSSAITSTLGYTPVSADTNTFTTGGTYSNGSLTLRNNTGGTTSISGFSTGYTLTSSAITSTLGYTPVSDLQYRNGGFTLFDDMHTAGVNQSPFTKANINSGTQSQAATLTTVNNSGAVQIFASTTTNSGGFIGFNNSASPASFYLTAGQQFDTIIIFDSFFSGTTTRCGILNGTNTSNDATNGCYIEVVNDQLIGKTASGSVRSTTSSYTLSLNTWYHLRVKVTSLSLITYSLYDMSGNQLWSQTLSTNIPPSNSSTLLQPALITTSTIGSSSRLITIDYIAITYPPMQRGALN